MSRGKQTEGENPSVTSKASEAKEMTTTGSITKADKEKLSNSKEVEFEFNYPKNYKGVKRFKEGDTRVVSSETAEIFIKKGIGKIK